MCSVGGSIKSSALEAMPDDRSDATGPLKTADGGFGAQKHTPTGTLRPFKSQIRCHRFANFRGQRQFAALATLAADAQLSRVPVDVIEFRDATSPERKPSRASRSRMA